VVRLAVAGESVPVLFVRHRRARRYVLRVRPDGTVRVTVPRGGTVEGAWAFAQRQAAWIQQQRQRQAAAPPRARQEWRPGTPVLFRGEAVPLTARALGETWVVQLAEFETPMPGIGGDLRTAVERALWQLARRELPIRVGQLAALHGLSVGTTQVRNQRSRWGSCSRRGTVCLNWRLIQAPPAVRDYVILHELMHLRHMNHSRKFWEAVAAACPGHREARDWLRRNEPRLR
jgi:predicted metal-dependent hydrolase